jgi:hypothetical protein
LQRGCAALLLYCFVQRGAHKIYKCLIKKSVDWTISSFGSSTPCSCLVQSDGISCFHFTPFHFPTFLSEGKRTQEDENTKRQYCFHGLCPTYQGHPAASSPASALRLGGVLTE